MANKIDTELEALKLEQLKANLEYAFECGINLKERVILLSGEVDDDMYQLVEIGLTELESYNHQQVTIRINSDGGDEYAAMAIVGRIKRSRCKIITEGYGSIMSAATLILASGKHRRLSKYAAFMIHEGAYNTDYEKHSNKKALVAHMEWMELQWAKWMSEMSKKSKNFYYEQSKCIDKYWSPETVLKYGIVDELF